MEFRITSTSNENVKRLSALVRKPRERRQQDVFIVEGIKMFLEAPEELRMEAWASEGFLEKHGEQLPADLLAKFGQDRQHMIVSDRVFASVSDTQSPQGILCVVRQMHYQLQDLLAGAGAQNEQKLYVQEPLVQGQRIQAHLGQRTKPENPQPLVMILENIQDPGNLGTIIRTAEGAGVTGILMSSGTVDLYNPKVTRSTMGSIYRMPYLYTEHLHEDIRWLQQQGLTVLAAHLKGTAGYDEEDCSGSTAFMIGNESRGLSDETAALADRYIRIPMLGQVESLNAAVASSILMYEAARQRRQTGKPGSIR